MRDFDDRSTVSFYATLLLIIAGLPVAMGSTSAAATVLVFGMAAAACNLLLGHAGLLSFAQGAFFGAGSYITGLLLKSHAALDAWALGGAALGGAAIAAVIGGLSIRQRGIYFVMITLAMAQLAYFSALSFPQLTGGENGLLDIPRPTLGLAGMLPDEQIQYLLTGALFLAGFAFLRRVLRSPFGRVLGAIRENEARALAVGYDVQLLKLAAFCMSGAITAVAGGLLALQLRSAPLSNVDIATSETILVMAILGGRKSLLGAVLGALAMTMMSQYLSPIWPRWQMVVGFVLIGAVLFAPDGLAGLDRRLLPSRKAASTSDGARADKALHAHKEAA